MIAEAQSDATYDDTQVKADIQANAEAIAAEKEHMDAFMSLGEGETLNAALDSLKELQDYITNEAADADIVVGKVAALEAIVAGIGGEGEPATVVAYVQSAVEALKIGDYAKAADLTAAVERIVALEGKSHTHDNKTVLDGITEAKVTAWDAAEGNAKTYADGLNTAMDTRVKALEGIDHDAYVAADATNLQAAKDYADGLAGNYDAKGAAATAETNAKSHADQLVAGLDVEDAAVAGKYVSAVSEADGKITVVRADLPVYEEVGSAAAALAEAKTYVDTAETDAVSAAKSYTDTALTWGTF